MVMKYLYSKPESKRSTNYYQETDPIRYIFTPGHPPFPQNLKMPRSFPDFPPPFSVQRPITFQRLPPIILSRIVKHIPDFDSLSSLTRTCHKLYYVVISTPDLLAQISRNYFPQRCLELLEVWRKGGMTADARDVLRFGIFSKLPQLAFVSLNPKTMFIEDRKGDLTIGSEPHSIYTAEIRRMKSDWWKVRCLAALCIVSELIIKSIDSQCRAQAAFDEEHHPDVQLDRALHEFKKGKVEEYLIEYRKVMKEMLAGRLSPEDFVDYFRLDGRFAVAPQTPVRNTERPVTPTRNFSQDTQDDSYDYDMLPSVPNSPVDAPTELGDSSFLTNLYETNTYQREPAPTAIEDIANAIFVILICFRDFKAGPPSPRWVRDAGRGRMRMYAPPAAERFKDNLWALANSKEFDIVSKYCDIASTDKTADVILHEAWREMLSFATLDFEWEVREWEEGMSNASLMSSEGG
ncbi:hypothetical protein BJ508DRAFT_347740 [Ascobolus immersus RN42]|uniref:F-box domain-containing protein n=1 Tax=Ascobolus immersus RN42 TaxID=1160509 RepID=A0A3N4IKZ8_ASCIM|nr:hypothetical protein BJ508DRAFT_347740 [Ascobolus immersus RN42]